MKNNTYDVVMRKNKMAEPIEDVMKILEGMRKGSAGECDENFDLFPIEKIKFGGKYLFEYTTLVPNVWPVVHTSHDINSFIAYFYKNLPHFEGIFEIPGIFVGNWAVACAFNKKFEHDAYSGLTIPIYIINQDPIETLFKVINFCKSYVIKEYIIENCCVNIIFEDATKFGIAVYLKKYVSKTQVLHNIDVFNYQCGFDGKQLYLTSGFLYGMKYSVNVVFNDYDEFKYEWIFNAGYAFVFPFCTNNEDSKFNRWLKLTRSIRRDMSEISEGLGIYQTSGNEDIKEIFVKKNESINDRISIKERITFHLDCILRHFTKAPYTGICIALKNTTSNDEILEYLTGKRNSEFFPSDDELLQQIMTYEFNLSDIINPRKYIKDLISEEEYKKFTIDLFNSDAIDGKKIIENYEKNQIYPAIIKFIKQVYDFENYKIAYDYNYIENLFTNEEIKIFHGEMYNPSPVKNDPTIIKELIYNEITYDVDVNVEVEDESSETCGMCRGNVHSDSANVCRLPCHKTHIFHMFGSHSCLGVNAWISKHKKCPLCNVNIKDPQTIKKPLRLTAADHGQGAALDPTLV